MESGTNNYEMSLFYDNYTNGSLYNGSLYGYEEEDSFEEDEDEDELWRTTQYRVFVYTMYAIVFILSVVGNGTVCYIIVSSPRMRSVRNYFIMNLAVSDIMFIIFCVPASSYEYLNQSFPFPAFLCPTMGFAQATSVFVSTYTLAAISVDRYMAIMWPLRPRLTKRFAIATIIFGWLLSGCVAAPVGLMSKVIPNNDSDGTYHCVEDWKNGGDEVYTNVLMILQYVIPFSILLYNYTSIGVMLWCHTIPGEAENSRDQRIARSKRNMIKMMMMVVFVFTICWLPYNILMILMKNKVDIEYLRYIWFGLHWLAMSHAIYNPFIYCYMNSRFRTGFVQVLANLPCIRCYVSRLVQHRSNTSSGFPLTSVEATDSTLLHRNNTCTTYVSMRRRQNGNRLEPPTSPSGVNVACNNNGHHHHHQVPVRSASVFRNSGSTIGNVNHHHHQVCTKTSVMEHSAATTISSTRSRYSPNILEDAI